MRFIIIGCGRMGAGLARTLSLRGHTITLVDKDRGAMAGIAVERPPVRVCDCHGTCLCRNDSDRQPVCTANGTHIGVSYLPVQQPTVVGRHHQ